jgi:hypothetical protein
MAEIKYTTYFEPFPEDVQPRTLPRVDKGAAPVADPYRGGDEGLALQQFGQHLSIAYDLADELVTCLHQYERAIRFNMVESAETARTEVGRRWETMWSQLDDARTLAARRGRDVSSYEQARTAAKDLSSGAADLEVGEWLDAGFNAYKRTVRYRIPRLDPAIAAIGALAAAVPEVPITRQPEAPDLRSGSWIPWKWIVIAIVVAAAIAIGVYEWNVAHRPGY